MNARVVRTAKVIVVFPFEFLHCVRLPFHPIFTQPLNLSKTNQIMSLKMKFMIPVSCAGEIIKDYHTSVCLLDCPMNAMFTQDGSSP